MSDLKNSNSPIADNYKPCEHIWKLEETPYMLFALCTECGEETLDSGIIDELITNQEWLERY